MGIVELLLLSSLIPTLTYSSAFEPPLLPLPTHPPTHPPTYLTRRPGSSRDNTPICFHVRLIRSAFVVQPNPFPYIGIRQQGLRTVPDALLMGSVAGYLERVGRWVGGWVRVYGCGWVCGWVGKGRERHDVRTTVSRGGPAAMEVAERRRSPAASVLLFFGVGRWIGGWVGWIGCRDILRT